MIPHRFWFPVRMSFYSEADSCRRLGFAFKGIFSIWQAIFEIACQWKIKPTQPVVSQIDRGRENQRLKSVKQSIILPIAPLRSLSRNCSIRPEPGPVVLRCLTRQPAAANPPTLKLLVLSITEIRLHVFGVDGASEVRKTPSCLGGGLSILPCVIIVHKAAEIVGFAAPVKGNPAAVPSRSIRPIPLD